MISKVIGKVYKGERVSFDEGVRLFESKDILTLGGCARDITLKRHTDQIVTYIVDRNINYTNICFSGCKFCAFYKPGNSKDGYVISEAELEKKILETKKLGGYQILLQGGLNPSLDINYYENLLKFIKSFDIHIHGFSPPEIIHISECSGITIKETLNRLIAAGLGSMPGGGAEVLVDSIRKKISPKKCSAGEWLNVMESAHNMGIKTSATMMYGHIESYKDRVAHLMLLRDLQDKTGGFTAFIPWPFQEFNENLIGFGSSGFDYLKTVAVSRLILDNFDNIQASWVTQGSKVAQLALFFGANDMGSTMIEENVVKAAGVSFTMSEEELCQLVYDAGFIPKRRDTFYNSV